jgi:predicted RNA-binding Zn-ribbon protein involved in translation (DUF1610 family)
MERRVHEAFGRRLFTSILALFVIAMASLALGMLGERARQPTVRAVGYCGFLACGAGIPLLAWWRSRGCRCPECGQWLTSDPARDREQSLRFSCSECGIEWDTQGIIDL